jgi:hypothetical protein
VLGRFQVQIFAERDYFDNIFVALISVFGPMQGECMDENKGIIVHRNICLPTKSDDE